MPTRQVAVGRPLTEGQVLSVRLGTPLRRVVQHLGPPSAGGPPRLGKDRCLYWQMVGHPASVARWRLCFRANRLVVVSTYLV